jgi:hypothetical protein
LKELGREYISPNEDGDTEEIITAITNRLRRDYAPGKTKRQFHAKMHGCLQATFTVEADVPLHLAFGFLTPGRTYQTWLRYSNGNTRITDDNKADLRGLAIKLLNVPGQILVQDEAYPQSQDFLLVTYPTLMSADVASFKRTIVALCGGFWPMLLFSLHPINWRTLIRTVKSLKKHHNLFDTQYWSVSPYRLGKSDQAVKYSVIPSARIDADSVDTSDSNFLRSTIERELKSGPRSFDFLIQLQEDAENMPIEDTTVEWKSPWKKVATITISPQNFNTAERNAFGENLTFSPWHCLKENQPLGGVNRARKAAYLALSRFRLERNLIKRP